MTNIFFLKCPKKTDIWFWQCSSQKSFIYLFICRDKCSGERDAYGESPHISRWHLNRKQSKILILNLLFLSVSCIFTSVSETATVDGLKNTIPDTSSIHSHMVFRYSEHGWLWLNSESKKCVKPMRYPKIY